MKNRENASEFEDFLNSFSFFSKIMKTFSKIVLFVFLWLTYTNKCLCIKDTCLQYKDYVILPEIKKNSIIKLSWLYTMIAPPTYITINYDCLTFLAFHYTLPI